VTFLSAVVGPYMVSFHGVQNPWRRPCIHFNEHMCRVIPLTVCRGRTIPEIESIERSRSSSGSPPLLLSVLHEIRFHKEERWRAEAMVQVRKTLPTGRSEWMICTIGGHIV